MTGASTGLLERDHELAMMGGMLDDAGREHGSVLIVEGPAGAGKSALLRELAHRGRTVGMRVLGAVGGELEREYPYGMVRQLLEAELLSSSPDRRASLLSGASALAAPILGATSADTQAGQDSSFATLHGLYWLVVALSDEAPLLLVLDDCHWSDASSLRFIEFLGRRVAELPVLVALGLRTGEPGTETALLDAIADGDEAHAVRPAPLTPDGAGALIRARLGERAGQDVVSAAIEATRGNPLLLSELAGSLARGHGALDADSVRAVVPSSVSRSVQRRLARLDPVARSVAQALATLGDRTPEVLVAQVCDQSPTMVAQALETLRGVELIVSDGSRFAHPLVRQAALEGVPVVERHRLHAAMARAIHDRGGDGEEVIVHLLARPALGEPWVREVLRAGARRAVAEGAPESAVRRLRRALEEETGPPEPGLLLELGEAGLRAGDPTALLPLARAAESDDPIVSARAMLATVLAESLSEDFDGREVLGRLRGTLDRLGPDAPVQLRDQVVGVLVSASTLNADLLAGRRALLETERFEDLPVLMGLRAFDGACGEMPRTDVRALVDRGTELLPFTSLAQVESAHAWWGIGALYLIDAWDVADPLLRIAEATARRHGSRLGRAWVSTLRGYVALYSGSVVVAEAAAREAIDLWAAVGFERLSTTSRALLAGALTRRGELEAAEQALIPSEGERAPFTRAMVLLERAGLRMAQRRTADAVADLREVQEIADALGQRRFGWGHTGASLALALVADGQRDEAVTVAEGELAVARAAGRDTLGIAALTARALAGPDTERLELLELAVATRTAVCSPLVAARALAEFGAALRRAGRPGDARRWLRDSIEVATRAGATALADHALQELVIAGGRPRSRFASGLESLTPSERRVAEHAAQGMSNREIAETLFVTRKTVELHLGNSYGKLGIRSRTQLAGVLAGGAQDPDED